MQDTENDTKINPISFKQRYDGMKQLLLGKQFEIAEKAGCNPMRVVNAISGKIVSPELLEPILEAMEDVAREELEKIQL